MVLLLWFACSSPQPLETPVATDGSESEPAPVPRPEPPPVRRVRLVAVGDVLPHRRVKARARSEGWSAVFSGVVEPVRAADIAFANLESPIAPDAHRGIHGEVFNAPASMAPGLADAGFDVVSMANNHVWDQGSAGLLETQRRVREAGVQTVGVGARCEDAAAPVVVERNGVRVAFIAFTDLINADESDGDACAFVPGELCREDCLPDRDALYFPVQADRVHEAIRAASEVADVVVVSAHWQTEYHIDPLPEYRPLARGFIDAGAHIVLGHHPHVLQPIETYEGGVIAYSLGNFVSDMGKTYDPDRHPVRKGDTRDGLLLAIDVAVQGESVRLDTRAVPTWTTQPEISVVLQSTLPPELRDRRSQRVREIVGASYADSF